MYAPQISIADPNTMTVACDMGGLYLSRDAGQRWTLLDGRQVREPAISAGNRLWQQDLADLAAFDLYHPDLLYTIGPNRPLRTYSMGTATWSTIPVTRDPAYPQLLNNLPAPAGPSIPGARRLFVTDVNQDGPEPFPRPAILIGLRGPTIAAATVKRDGTVTAVLEVRPDGTTAPIQGRCMAITACFDPGLEWQVPLLATRTGLYSGMDRVDNTRFRKVGSGLPVLADHLFLWDLACAWYGERHLYATVVSDTGDQAAGVYTTTDAQGGGWTKATGLPADAVYGPIAAGGVIQYVANDQASRQRARTVYVAAWSPSSPPYVRVYRSRDAGASWQHTLNVAPNPADNPGGSAQNLAAGGGWVDQSPFGPDFGGAGRGLAASASVPASVVFTNLAALHVSLDDGDHWREGYTRPDGPSSANASIGLEVTTAWNYVQFPGPTSGSSRQFICYSDIAAALGESAADGSVTWRSQRPTARSANKRYNTFYELAVGGSSGPAGWLWAAAALSHDLPYSGIGDPEGGVLRSTDFGSSWSDSSNGLPMNAPAVSIVIDPTPLNTNDPANSRQLWVAMYGSGVWRTTNSGSAWTQSGLAGKAVYRLHRHADGRLFCSIAPSAADATGELWTSTDGGVNWTQIPLTLPYSNPSQPGVGASTLLRDYSVHPTNSNVLFVCTAGSWAPQQRNGGVWKTVDRGGTWTHVPALDNARTNSPGVIPPYDPDFVSAFGAFFHPGDSHTVLVTTTAHGTWYSTDAGGADPSTGSQWQQLTSLPFMACQRVAFDAAANAMYVTTFGSGVWRLATGNQPPMPWPGRRLRVETPMMRGNDVAAWQRAIVQAGTPLTIDGIYGNKSRDACLALQQRSGLVPDGVVGPGTWEATARRDGGDDP
jgi:photosystem II stability/assembly factor-like uncharacterized protein